MQHILQTVERIAVSDLGVLISGEPSTGKEWIARMIHELLHPHPRLTDRNTG